ncbi:MAG TPA: hypothetical protein PLS36_05170, partial [Clostridia bacterium]|nr:hypothetical protein [Clostridia bacterium]
MESQILIHPDELSENWIKRAKENSIDVIGIHPVGGYRASESLSELVELMEDNNFTNLIDEAIEQGIKIEYEMHAASYLLPRDLFLSNPEYFRMDENGNRTNDK